MDRAGLDAAVEEAKPGRPNVIGRAGERSGPTLLLLAHMDTVGTAGMKEPHEPRIEGDRLYGRGAYDMKAGLAAAMTAGAALTDVPGEVVVAAVSDEEAGGIGTKALLASGREADAAIVTEPTDLAVAIAHKGFAAFEIETAGRAAPGSQPELGEDAILAMGPVLVELEALNRRLQGGPAHPLLGPASLHASLVEGGQEASSYPERCLLTGEWRTLPGDEVMRGLRDAIARSGIDAEVRLTYEGHPFETPPDAEVVQILRRHAGTQLKGARYWADSALLAGAGISTVLFGPLGGGAHATVEWVDLPSVERVRDVLVSTAREFCARG
jgi:acetylornithine deacetylase